MPVININNDDIRLNSSSSDKVVVNGNLGIGTTSPATLLHVSNAGSVTGRFSNTATSVNTEIGVSGGLGYVGTQSANAFGIVTSDTERMRITGDGNVGIGTTSPSTKLEVGNFLDAVTNKITVAARYEYEPEFNFRLGQSGTNLDWIGAVISSGDDGNYNGKILFKTANAGRDTPTTKMIIKANGNVGIGTTSPLGPLDVRSTGLAQIYFGYPNAGEYGYLGRDANTGLYSLNVVQNANLAIWTNNTERMRITNTGNVGIGTTSPAYKLDVAGTTKTAGLYSSGANIGFESQIAALGTNGAYQAGYYLGATNTSYAARIGMDVNSGDVYIGIGTTSGLTNTTYFKANGNVGIGTTSPAYKLDIGSNTSETFRISAVATSGSTGNLLFGSNVIVSQAAKIQGIYGGSWDGALAFFTQDAGAVDGNRMTEKVRILSNGNVGIGTTSPSYKLDVNVASNSDALRIQQAGTSKFILTGDGVMTWGSSAANGVLTWDTNIVYIGGLTNNALGLRTNGSEKVRITTGGDVGIGTTNPIYKLQVAGSAYVNGGTLFIDSEQYLRWGNSAQGIRGVNDTSLEFVSGSSERMRITAAGNVGIGTTSPYDKLEVNGAIAATGSVVGDSGQGHSTTLAVQSGVSYLYAVDWGAEFKPLSIQGKTISLETGTGSTSARVTIDNSGNVGIGTTSPGMKVDVVGGSQLTGTVFGTLRAVQDQTNYRGVVLGYDTSGQIGIIYPETPAAASNLAFWTYTGSAWGERMRITSAGNVGIGTTAPSELLTVAGTTDLAWSASTSKLQISRSSTVARLQNYENGSASTNLALQWEGGNVGIGTTSPSEKLHVVGTILSDQGEARFKFNSTSGTGRAYDMIGGNDGKFYFYDRTATSYRYVIDASGNVGIGTTSPAQKLDVNGASILARGAVSIDPDAVANSVIAGAISDTSWGVSSGIAGMGSGAGDTWAIGHNNTNLYFGIGNGTAANSMATYIEVTPSRDITFNGQVRITSGGNVGIGTTAPTYKLDVVGSARIDSTSNLAMFVKTNSAFGAAISYEDSTTGGNDVISAGAIGGDFYISTNYSERVRVTSAGNVGIGTTSPAKKLHVYNSGPNQGLRVSNADGVNMDVLSGANGGIVGTYSNHPLSLYTNSTEKVTITAAGNVGIGTTSPTEKLHVDGSVVVTYNNSYQSTNSTGNKAILARVSPTSGIVNYAEYATVTNLNGFVIGSDDAQVKGVYASDKLEFITNTATRMAITSGGNVGIGTASPTNILHITGVMRMDNVSANDPTLTNNATPKHGYGDVANEIYLAEPAAWFKINVEGTDYIIPAYLEAV